MATMRSTTKSEPFVETEESEAAKSYNNILKEIEESQANSIPVSLSYPAVHFVPAAEFPDYMSTNYYESCGKNYPQTLSETMPLIVNNHEAHQHSPPKLPLKTIDGCLVIEPAHSNSFAKNSFSCEGAVPLIKQEVFKINHEHDFKNDGKSKEYFENLMHGLRSKCLVNDSAEADGGAVDVETVSQTGSIPSEKTSRGSWTTNPNPSSSDDHNMHPVDDCHVEPGTMKNLWGDVFESCNGNKIAHFTHEPLPKYDKRETLHHVPQILSLLDTHGKQNELSENNIWEDFANEKSAKKEETLDLSKMVGHQQQHNSHIPNTELWCSTSQNQPLSQTNVDVWLNQQIRNDHIGVSAYEKNNNNRNLTQSYCTPNFDNWERNQKKIC